MSHEKQDHPFHLVNPSPWPLLGAFALLCTTGGTAMFMHKVAAGKPVMILGILLILTTMFVWWRDVIGESMHDHAHTPAVSHGLRIGMALFILSEVMFFVAFFWAFFGASIFPKVSGGGGVWQGWASRPSGRPRASCRSTHGTSRS